MTVRRFLTKNKYTHTLFHFWIYQLHLFFFTNVFRLILGYAGFLMKFYFTVEQVINMLWCKVFEKLFVTLTRIRIRASCLREKLLKMLIVLFIVPCYIKMQNKLSFFNIIIRLVNLYCFMIM